VALEVVGSERAVDGQMRQENITRTQACANCKEHSQIDRLCYKLDTSQDQKQNHRYAIVPSQSSKMTVCRSQCVGPRMVSLAPLAGEDGDHTVDRGAGLGVIIQAALHQVGNLGRHLLRGSVRSWSQLVPSFYARLGGEMGLGGGGGLRGYRCYGELHALHQRYAISATAY